MIIHDNPIHLGPVEIMTGTWCKPRFMRWQGGGWSIFLGPFMINYGWWK